MRQKFKTWTVMNAVSFRITLLILVVAGVCTFGSCTLFRPLPLDPVKSKETVQSIDRSGFSSFNGNYELVSVDTSSNRLDFAFTFKAPTNLKQLPERGDYIHLSTPGFSKVEAIVFRNGKEVKRKTIKGRMNNNRFQFHSSNLSVRVIFNVFRQQTNRIALLENGDLLLDTNSGGIAFFFILPIPLSGSANDTYNLRFRKRNN